MNAIILAAGLGSRFKSITKDNHKALLKIGGIPNIERTILYLKEKGIDEIVVVTGHKAELFDYLIPKYGVKLIYNEHYKSYNNIYSFYKAIDHFEDSFVIDADVVLLKNVFLDQFEQSLYFTVQRDESADIEWCPILNDGRVTAMDITDAFLPSMIGISYWCEEDCHKIKVQIEDYLAEEMLLNPKMYWDHIPVAILDQLNVTTYLLDNRYAGEMDTIENYYEICEKVNLLND